MKLFRLIIGACVVSTCISCYSTPSTPLYNAAVKGNIKSVMRLVGKGADINETVRNNTPLEIAAARGRLEVVEYLLARNAGNPQRAFELAMRNNHTEIAKYLIDNDFIDVNLSATSFDRFFRDETIPFEQRMENAKAFSNGKLHSPSLLTIVPPAHYQDVEQYFEINLYDAIDELGNTILHRAAMDNKVELVQYLLDSGFDVNVLDNNNHTALFYNITTVYYRINWANPIIENEDTAHINFHRGDMPFYANMHQLKMRRSEITLLLVNAGINVNQQNIYGWSVLHFTFAAYSYDLRDFLIERGADLNLKTNFGRTAQDIPRDIRTL